MLSNTSIVSHIHVSNATEPTIDLLLNKIETISLLIFFSLTVVGNTSVIVILLVCKSTGKQSLSIKNVSRMSFYIINLCVADICVAFLSILPEFIWRYHVFFPTDSNVLCKFHKFSQVTCRNFILFFQSL
jgi:hypothetical protein